MSVEKRCVRVLIHEVRLHNKIYYGPPGQCTDDLKLSASSVWRVWAWESWVLGRNICQRVQHVCSWLPTQLKREKEKKWYEETETGRTLVTPCDARDRATCICESEQNSSAVMECQRKGENEYIL